MDTQKWTKELDSITNDFKKAFGAPAARVIVYRLETAFDIIVAHERRHFEQAKEVYLLQNQ
jgi:hypothetical protein